MNVFVKGK